MLSVRKQARHQKRLDRTQVFEYNKSVSSKASAAAKRAKAEKLLKDDMMSTGSPSIKGQNSP